MEAMSVTEIVRLLDLAPHPEGGFYRETFRDPHGAGGRADVVVSSGQRVVHDVLCRSDEG